MMLKILVPIDFSKNAWNATKYAIQFFENQEAIFYFLHIDSAWAIESEPDLYRTGFLPSEVDRNTKTQEIQQWMDRVSVLSKKENHQYLSSIKKAPFIKGVREYLTDQKINFMVLGTKGASGLKAVTIGSKTGEMITKVKCTTLVIPERATFSTPLNITFPTDYNSIFVDKILVGLRHFLTYYNSSVKVLRVAQNKEKLSSFQKVQRAYLKSQLATVNHSFHVIENKKMEDGLEVFAHKMHIDVVAMIAKNLNFFQKLFFTPRVAQLTYSATIPFLILHE